MTLSLTLSACPGGLCVCPSLMPRWPLCVPCPHASLASVCALPLGTFDDAVAVADAVVDAAQTSIATRASRLLMNPW